MKTLLPLVLALVSAPISSYGLLPVAPQPAQAAASTSGAADLAVVRERYVRAVLPVGHVAIAQVNALSQKYAETLTAEGSWPDIKYTDDARSVWVNADHLNRLLVMAKSARVLRNSGHPNEALEGKILLALKWWTDHDYTNPNWWWNQIGVPQLVGEIGSLLGPQLPDEQRAKIVEIMKRATWRTLIAGRSPWTGANLTWGVGIQIVRGCLENDPAPVAEGFERMFQEIKIMPQPAEGIEQDYSFHQHGMQLYSGGYGLDFANDVGRYISFSWGTSFQIPADRMTMFSAYLLEGEQWMIRGNVFDYSAVGREITRAGKVAAPRDQTGGPIYPANAAAYGLGNTMALLAAEPTPRQKELTAFANRLNGKAGAAEFTGNKMFWDSDFMVHRRAGYSTSVRMLSKRMVNSELINNEGRKSVHMSDGANFIYLTGDEYKDIFAAWDWTKIPGTTAIQGTLDTGEKSPIMMIGTTTFDGGVSDGTYGMAAMDLARGKLVAKKAWFFFDSEYVALGAGITVSDDKEHNVATAVNQSLLAGDVLTSEAKEPTAGTQAFDAAHPVWVYHDHVGYYFVPGTKVHVSAGPQTGAWSDIGTGSSTPVTTPVFNLWIDQGRAPQDGSYQYTVVPNISAGQLAKYAASADLDVLSNTKSIQAVYSRSLKLAEIAFREAGSLTTPLGEVKADHSCLLLVRQGTGGWKVTASNPESQPLTLHLTVKGKQTTIELPGGNFAGSSVSVDVR